MSQETPKEVLKGLIYILEKLKFLSLLENRGLYYLYHRKAVVLLITSTELSNVHRVYQSISFHFDRFGSGALGYVINGASSPVEKAAWTMSFH